MRKDDKRKKLLLSHKFRAKSEKKRSERGEKKVDDEIYFDNYTCNMYSV